MLEQVRQDVDSRIAPLISGIAEDLRLLLSQEFALARSEMRKQIEEAGAAGALMVVGAACGIVSSLILALGIVACAAAFVPSIPLWGWFFIVGGLFLVLGIGLIRYGKGKFSKVSIVPERTLQTLKETVHV